MCSMYRNNDLINEGKATFIEASWPKPYGKSLGKRSASKKLTGYRWPLQNLSKQVLVELAIKIPSTLLLSGLLLFAIVSMGGCCRPMNERLFSRPQCDSVACCQRTGLFGSIQGRFHERWLLAKGSFHSMGASVGHHLHDNCITRAIAAKHEANNAPPWPRFHPLPNGPIFYPEPDPSELTSLGPRPAEQMSEPFDGSLPPPVAEPTANYGQFSPAQRR